MNMDAFPVMVRQALQRYNYLILPALSGRNAFPVIIFFAMVTHLVFKRWEPMRLSVVLPLLVGVPAALSTLLHPHYGATSGITMTFITHYTSLLLSIIVYRVSPFHPLAQYPGPFLAKITKLYHAWQVYKGKQHIYLKDLHERYGEVVRTGPNDLSMRDASCIQPALGAQGMPKGPFWDGRGLYAPVPTVVGCRDPAEHAIRRKPWNRAFNTASLKEFQPFIESRVHQLVDGLSKRQGQAVDIAEWMSFFTYDFMGDMVFGGWTEMLRDGKDDGGLWDIVHRGMDVGAIYSELPWIGYYAKRIPVVGQDLKRMRQMSFDRAAQRYTTGSSAKTCSIICNEDGSEKVSPPRHIVVSDGVTALVAGSDTTATVLSNIIYLLVCNADVYKRLQEEIDKFYPRGENSLDPQPHKDMHYLEAVINEALRMFPPVPSGTSRAPEVKKGDKVIGTYYIPEGTQVRVPFWAIHRDARNFSYPDSFWPDRWLIASGLQSSDKKIVHNADAFIPFSFGPYNCVGKPVAMQEMRTVICHLMHSLNFRLAERFDPAEYEHAFRDQFAAKVGELRVVVERRD